MSSKNPETKKAKPAPVCHRASTAAPKPRALPGPHGEHAAASPRGTRPRHHRGLSFPVPEVLRQDSETAACFPGLTERPLLAGGDVTAAGHDVLPRTAPHHLVSSIIPSGLTESAFERMLPKCKLPRRLIIHSLDRGQRCGDRARERVRSHSSGSGRPMKPLGKGSAVL